MNKKPLKLYDSPVLRLLGSLPMLVLGGSGNQVESGGANERFPL